MKKERIQTSEEIVKPRKAELKKWLTLVKDVTLGMASVLLFIPTVIFFIKYAIWWWDVIRFN